MPDTQEEAYSHDRGVSSARGDICVRFGQRLRKLRLEREREPCLRTLEIIAQGFEVTVPQLLSRV